MKFLSVILFSIIGLSRGTWFGSRFRKCCFGIADSDSDSDEQKEHLRFLRKPDAEQLREDLARFAAKLNRNDSPATTVETPTSSRMSSPIPIIQGRSSPFQSIKGDTIQIIPTNEESIHEMDDGYDQFFSFDQQDFSDYEDISSLSDGESDNEDLSDDDDVRNSPFVFDP